MRFVHASAERLTRVLLDNTVAELVGALTEFEQRFLQEKFVGGAGLSIADFLLAPIVFCLRHRAVQRELRFRISVRAEKWLADFEQAVPWSQSTFFKVVENEKIDSLNEYLTSHARSFHYDLAVIEEKVAAMSVPAPSKRAERERLESERSASSALAHAATAPA